MPITTKTADGIEVEITHCDAGYPPGNKPSNILNRTSVWFRPTGGEWIRSKHRSAIRTAYEIHRVTLAAIKSISDSGPDLITSQEKSK